ncbi:hypothetical protein Aeqsu_0828 [Aequorivita sublithincola DSM 14238]|uniref:Lipocalin-like domain-containing protein n=1 Tax=Aequorivita sublithincola (strain DSM 14238 / LMG 21431 / ACAM 643 / 9-3) TaxID=746697 RepID=I3YTL4_AEQSU|nr:hypothetical protein [Aequorivita sublithincola]AFL80332.1 hypothetical protein Aeqsu_0828 [Aequorivita sublithincola DSM 14238]
MKNLKIYKSVILILVLISIIACSKDDDNEILSNDLIGEWQRSDFSNEFEYKLIFNSDNTGYKIETEGDIAGGTAISSLVTFNWTTTDTILTMNFDGEIINTNFSINANDQLHLSDFTDLYFIKINK